MSKQARLKGVAVLVGLVVLLAGARPAMSQNSRNTPPRVVSRVEPEYTQQAQDAKLAGTVLLRVAVGTDGVAHNINVVKGLGMGLDEKAVEAVQKWHFQPATRDGEPVSISAQIEVNFRLK